MKTKFLLFLLFTITIFTFSDKIFAQIENVPLTDPVYNFLKEMRVKRIITDYNDDDPNMSRFQVADRLKTMYKKKDQLTKTENEILKKYMIEFVPEELNSMTTTSLFGGNTGASDGLKGLVTDKQKYLFAYQKNKNNIFINVIGNLFYVNGLKPTTKSNSWLFDGGIDIRGSLFEKLGYNLSVAKGGAAGDSVLIASAYPQITSTFKYVENIENIINYDFTNGYIKYYTSPSEGMDLSIQIGREQLKYGLGYSKRLALSGDAPNMDFLKFNFKYGIVNFSSIFGSTIGEFTPVRDLRYTKYFTANRLKLSFDKLFDVGIGETIISSRGIELGYLNPLLFYKFAEMSLQDRDNGTLFFDVQTHFLKDLEFQGTFFLDENILSNLSDLEKQTNKTAYQLGFYWYEPVGFRNFSLIFEYTKIRPYVYTHFDPENIYTGFGVILGHPIGPNADQLFVKMNYNFSARVSANMEFQKTRKGENVYNSNGDVVINVGGSVYDTFVAGRDSDIAYFLDGIRVNDYSVRFNLVYEPLLNYTFDLNYVYNISKNLTDGNNIDQSFAFVRFNIGY
ncbi:MAG: hypothetical protein WAT71_07480 [Ignavibacteria bacterium]